MDGLNWTIKKRSARGRATRRGASPAKSMEPHGGQACSAEAGGRRLASRDGGRCGSNRVRSRLGYADPRSERRGRAPAENYWLFGNVVFLNEERNVALHVEILGGAADRRRTIGDALQGARTVPQGLRWMGSIVPSGPSLRARVSGVEHQLATRLQIVCPGGLGASAFFDRNGTLRMRNTKIKQALARAPCTGARRQSGCGSKSRVSARATGASGGHGPSPFGRGLAGLGRTALWPRSVRRYVYLTVHGGLEPTYQAEGFRLQHSEGSEERCRRNGTVIPSGADGPEKLLAYAKRITRDHGRAQGSINRLRTRVEQLEQALGDDAPPRTSAPGAAPHQCTAPHRCTVRLCCARRARRAMSEVFYVRGCAGRYGGNPEMLRHVPSGFGRRAAILP